MSNKYPVVSLVGRANVGKSSLFNCFARNTRSLVFDYPGVTRDCVRETIALHDATNNETVIELVDTGGLSGAQADGFEELVFSAARNVIIESTLVVLLVDGTVGVQEADIKLVRMLYALRKEVIVAVNKIDCSTAQERFGEFYTLGVKRVVKVSAQHRIGIDELEEMIITYIGASTKQDWTPATPSYRVTIIGKPNVGKSSLLNKLLGYDRALVSPQAGTTREAVTSPVQFYQQTILVSDTPGIRQKHGVTDDLEKCMVHTAFEQLKDADIVVLVIDGTAGILCDQELKLAFYAWKEQHKGLIIIRNKADNITAENDRALEQQKESYKHLCDNVPWLTISCLSGKNVGKVVPLIDKVWQRHSTLLPHMAVKELIQQQFQKTPIFRLRQKLMVEKIEQIGVAPMTFLVKTNKPTLFDDAARGFLERLLRTHFDLLGVPLRLVIR
jgi:GTP-binding protein